MKILNVVNRVVIIVPIVALILFSSCNESALSPKFDNANESVTDSETRLNEDVEDVDESRGPAPLVNLNCNAQLSEGQFYSCGVNTDAETMDTSQYRIEMEKSNTCSFLTPNQQDLRVQGTPKTTDVGSCTLSYIVTHLTTKEVVAKRILPLSIAPISLLSNLECSLNLISGQLYSCGVSDASINASDYTISKRDNNTCTFLVEDQSKLSLKGISSDGDADKCTLSYRVNHKASGKVVATNYLSLTISRPSPSIRDVTSLGFVSVKDFGAKGDGVTDDTLAIKNAISAAYTQKLSTFFPSGTYLVSDTIEMIQPAGDGGNGYILIGSKIGKKPIIKLKDGSAGFGACAGYPDSSSDCILTTKVNTTTCSVTSRPSIKPVIFFWKRGLTCPNDAELSDGSRTYNNVVKNIDFDLGKNSGSVAIRHWGAEGARTENVSIHASGGFAGIYELISSGGFTSNIQVTGGKFGIYAPRARGGGSLIMGVTLIEQTVQPIFINTSYPVTIVGFLFKKKTPVMTKLTSEDVRANHLVLIDGSMEVETDSSSALVVNGSRSVYLQNVFSKGAKKIISHSADNSSLSASSTNQWSHIREYSYSPDYDLKFGDNGRIINHQKSLDTLLDGNLYSSKSLTVSTSVESIPTNLLSRHIIPTKICDIEDNLFINVKSYGAVGDGKKDDTLAINSAIKQAASLGHNKVVLPAGNFLVSGSIELLAKTELCGVGKGISSLSSGSWNPSTPTPVLKTTDDIDGMAAVSNFSISVNYANVYGIHWRHGRNSLYDGVGVGPSDTAQESDKFLRKRIIISGNGGGRWYGHMSGQGYWLPQHPQTRIISIEGTSQPLTFYHMHAQYLKPNGNPMVEIKNSSNVMIYSWKQEFLPNMDKIDRFPDGTIPIVLGIKNSSNIQVFGMEGLAFTDRGDGVIEVEEGSNITIANIARRPQTYYPEDSWYLVKVTFGGISLGVEARSMASLIKTHSEQISSSYPYSSR